MEKQKKGNAIKKGLKKSSKKTALKKFVLLENIAIADIAFEAFGKNLNELFENSAFAVAEIIADSKKIKPKFQKTIKLKANSIENLLYDFLSELIYLKDAEGIVFCKFKIKIIEKDKEFFLNAKIVGQKISAINPQFLRNDAKAITMHMFSVKKIKQKWVARIVVDV